MRTGTLTPRAPPPATAPCSAPQQSRAMSEWVTGDGMWQAPPPRAVTRAGAVIEKQSHCSAGRCPEPASRPPCALPASARQPCRPAVSLTPHVLTCVHADSQSHLPASLPHTVPGDVAAGAAPRTPEHLDFREASSLPGWPLLTGRAWRPGRGAATGMGPQRWVGGGGAMSPAASPPARTFLGHLPPYPLPCCGRV